MKAGDTNYDVGTKVMITFISTEEDKELEGLTGEITHPFGGLMAPGVAYTVGIRLDKKGIVINDICNLTKKDVFIPIDIDRCILCQDEINDGYVCENCGRIICDKCYFDNPEAKVLRGQGKCLACKED